MGNPPLLALLNGSVRDQGHGKRPEGFMLTDELHYMCYREVQRAYNRPQDFTQEDRRGKRVFANRLVPSRPKVLPNKLVRNNLLEAVSFVIITKTPLI